MNGLRRAFSSAMDVMYPTCVASAELGTIVWYQCVSSRLSRKSTRRPCTAACSCVAGRGSYEVSATL